MKFCPWYQSDAIRADYSRHVLRAMREGFRPLTLAQFGNGLARAFYLAGAVRASVPARERVESPRRI
jgi:hypothetical protein